MLTPEEKTKIIKKSKIHETDTGSDEVQIALLSEEIKKLLSQITKFTQSTIFDFENLYY